MKNMVVIETFGPDGLVETIQMEPDEYYDGDAYDDIISVENLVSKNITRLKLTQYGTQGRPYQIWMRYFDAKGDNIKDEKILDEEYS